MGDLAISVRLCGHLVEDRVVPVRRLVRIGESATAAVSFPGADLAVVRVGRDLAVRGRRLAEGQAIGVSLGPVRVWLEHTVRPPRLPGWTEQIDLRFFATALMVTVVGLWCETLDSAVAARSHHGFLSRQVAALRLHEPHAGSSGAGAQEHGGQRTAAVSAAGEAGEASAAANRLREGPAAVSDDERSGVDYYGWYRSVVTGNQALPALARERLVRDPGDAGAHEILAAEAYAEDQHEIAVRHYRWLAERAAVRGHSLDHGLLWHQAEAERRLGRHVAEAACYDAILAADPDDPWALAGLATVMARLGRFDEARGLLDRSAAVSEGDRYFDVYAAVVAAEQGQGERALELLERVVTERDALPPESQVELRRDLALDPAFAALRADNGLRRMLVRHLGAAAPRPVP